MTFQKGNKHGRVWKAIMDKSIAQKDANRFWSKVQKTHGCWIWAAALQSAGYGVFRVGGTPGTLLYAHRYSYEQTKGLIPEGMHLDHLCRNPSCVNPDHLEAVTPRVNCLRGVGPSAQSAKKTHCSKGHPFEGQNLYLRPDRVGRQCLTCKHENWDRWYAKKKEKDAKLAASKG